MVRVVMPEGLVFVFYLFMGVAVWVFHRHRYESLVLALRGLTPRLRDVELSVDDSFFPKLRLTELRGRFSGRQLRIKFQGQGNRLRMRIELELGRPRALEVTRPWSWWWSGTHWSASAGMGGPVSPATHALLDALFEGPAVMRVSTEPGRGGAFRLVIERQIPGSGSGVVTEDLGRTLALARKLALEVEGPRLGVRVGGPELEVKALASDRTRCPYCHDGLGRDASEVDVCLACRTAQHAECRSEAGGCAVYGCAGGAVIRRRAVARQG
jgi:hypothetical protein